MSRMAYINIEKAGKTALVNEDLDRIAGILNTSAEEILLGDTRGMLMERIEELEKALEEQKRVLEEQRVRYGESMRAKDDIIRMLMERSE